MRGRRLAQPVAWLALLLLSAGAALAQEPPAAATNGDDGVSARLTAPAGDYTVGDPVTLKLTVTHPPGAVIDYPDATALSAPGAGDAAGAASAASAAGGASFMVEKVDPVEAKPPLPGTTSWSIRIRLFAPGPVVVPALPITYRLPGTDGKRTVSTEPLTLTVRSVLESPEEAPADIKGPWRLPRAWWVPLLMLLLATAVIGGAVILWRRRRRRPAGAAPGKPVPAEPAEPAWIRAMRDLDALLAARLLEQGRIKEFHVVLSEIVKRFLGEHHRFDALDRTTEEVLRDLRSRGVPAAVAGRTREFLEACDLVKFAKHAPEADAIRETVSSARALIETGKPSPGEEVAAA